MTNDIISISKSIEALVKFESTGISQMLGVKLRVDSENPSFKVLKGTISDRNSVVKSVEMRVPLTQTGSSLIILELHDQKVPLAALEKQFGPLVPQLPNPNQISNRIQYFVRQKVGNKISFGYREGTEGSLCSVVFDRLPH